MNFFAHQQHLVNTRRTAELTALAGARRVRHRELVLVELYLAQISSSQGHRSRASRAGRGATEREAQPRIDDAVSFASASACSTGPRQRSTSSLVS
jgi:hypothetical protein